MRKFLTIILSCLILTSCATRKKYGCGLASNSKLVKGFAYKEPVKPICRGIGHVEVIDSNTCLIRIAGMIRDDKYIADAKFVLVNGKFSMALKPFKNQTILFECKPGLNSNFSDIVYTNEGCIESKVEEPNKLVNKF